MCIDILKETKSFYENLYTEKETIEINKTNYTQIPNKLTKLNNTEKLQLERPISLDDLRHIVYE